MDLIRDYVAEPFNRILNHPEVRPWVSDSDSAIDITSIVKNTRNIVLRGEFGGCILVELVDGLHEVHVYMLPEGRGAWARDFLMMGMYYMFTSTSCMDIVTRIPEGNPAAKQMCLMCGMQKESTSLDACKFQGRLQPVDIYSIQVNRWISLEDNLIGRGRDFYDQVHADALKKFGANTPLFEDDEDRLRYAGACYAMVRRGQVRKGVAVYNRHEFVARRQMISLVSEDPVVIKTNIGVLSLNAKNEIEMVQSC